MCWSCVRLSTCIAVLVLMGLLNQRLTGADPAASQQRDIVMKLQPWQRLIGEWRGIGQPKRGSNKGTWQETAQVAWRLTGKEPGIVVAVTDGKQWTQGLLTTGEKDAQLLLKAQLDSQTERLYYGEVVKDRLVLESPADPSGEVHRVTLSWLSDDRAIWLFEKKQAQQSFYQRVAEVAYQRQGTKLAAKDGSGPECVVTGGLGTIPVMYEGQTYYVCCTGCRDAFNDDPKGILAEYEQRKRDKTQQ